MKERKRELENNNKQLKDKVAILEELNESYGKEIKLSELKQWSPSGIARQVLDSKEFASIIEELLKTYSECKTINLKSQWSSIIGEVISKKILEIHNKVLEKEKSRLKERLKNLKENIK